MALALVVTLVAGQARAVLLDFTFADGARVDGTATAFDSGGTVGSYMTVGGVNLTMVSGFGPAFTFVASSTAGQNDYSWNGIDYVASTTNYPGLGQVGISNPSIPGTNDSNHFNPQESWTVNFDAPVIFRTLNARNFEGADTMRITIGASVFDFVDSDFDGGDAKSDPFGASFVIPTGTSITLLNSGTYTSLPLTGPTNGAGPPSGGNVWGLEQFIVEVVPEPSCFYIMSLGMVGVAAMRRRQR